MTTDHIRPGDIVQLDDHGRLYHAHVFACVNGGLGLHVGPIEKDRDYPRRVSATQLVAHWPKYRPRQRSRGKRAPQKVAG